MLTGAEMTRQEPRNMRRIPRIRGHGKNATEVKDDTVSDSFTSLERERSQRGMGGRAGRWERRQDVIRAAGD